MTRTETSSSLKKSFITSLLIPTIILQFPLPLIAAEPEYIAVLELHQRGARPDHTRKITDRFREELSRYQNLKVLTREESKVIVDYHHSSIIETGDITPSQMMVSKAKRAYFQLALQDSENLCDRAIERAMRTPARERNYRALQEAYIVKGIVAMAEHRKSDATESFRKVVYYNPKIQLDKRYFAPSVVHRMNRARDELKDKPLGSIAVTSKPAAADIYINGVFIGAAPVQIDGYPEGEHVVSVKAANYKTQTQIVKVRADKTVQVAKFLRWRGKDRRLPADMVGFHRSQFESFEHLISSAAAAARDLRVRKLILVELRREKGKDVVTAHAVDARLQTFHRPQSVTANNIKRESARVSAVLATQVLDEMNHTIMKNPSNLAAAPYYGDVVLIGRKRSLLKSPWFWASVGAVAAGGATAGVLLGTGGSDTVGAIDVIFR